MMYGNVSTFGLHKCFQSVIHQSSLDNCAPAMFLGIFCQSSHSWICLSVCL